MAQANEQVTQSASNPKATESANGPIEPADERQAREIEWIRKLLSDAAQNPPPVPARPLAAGRPVLRRPIGLLLAASIFVAAFVSSSQIDPAKPRITNQTRSFRGAPMTDVTFASGLGEIAFAMERFIDRILPPPPGAPDGAVSTE
jgi:hypothetical protein